MSQPARSPLWLRLVWFFGLWAAGVASVTLVGYLIRIWLI